MAPSARAEAADCARFEADITEVRGNGLWLAIDFTTNKETRDIYPMSSLNNLLSMAREKGALLKAMPSTLEFAPPLVITKEDIDESITLLDEIIGTEEANLGL